MQVLNTLEKLNPFRTENKLIISSQSDSFRKRFFPSSSTKDWNNWRWQLQNRIRTIDQFSKLTILSEEEQLASQNIGSVPTAVTPYYAGVIFDQSNQEANLRKTVIPIVGQGILSTGESDDPLGEENLSPTPSIIHRYPDRVVFLSTLRCSVYCRYCTRGRLVGKEETRRSKNFWKEGIDYIRNHGEIKDVLISGGDPLILDDNKISWLLKQLREIPHVEIIRIGTKVPLTLPQRMTKNLIHILKQANPLIFSLHVIDQCELTAESEQACAHIADSGILMGSQTVLLKGVNDSTARIRDLMRALLRSRVRPYYLLQCDAIRGSSNFRTSIRKGMEIIEELRGYISGYAIPQFIIDPLGGSGKIALSPEVILKWEEGGVWLKNWQGKSIFVQDGVK